MHKLHPSEVIVSVFRTLVPLGHGGYAIMQMGRVGMQISLKSRTLIQSARPALYVLGFIVTLVIHGFGGLYRPHYHIWQRNAFEVLQCKVQVYKVELKVQSDYFLQLVVFVVYPSRRHL